MKRNYDDDDNEEARPPETPSPEDSPVVTSHKEPIDERIEALKTFLDDKYHEFPGSEKWTDNYLYSSIEDEEEINGMNDVKRSEVLAKRHDAYRDIKQWRNELREAEASSQQPPSKKSKKSGRSSKRSDSHHKKSKYYSSEEEEEEEEEVEDEDEDDEEEYDDNEESDHNYDEEDDDEDDEYDSDSNRRKSRKKESDKKRKSSKSKSKSHRHHKHSDDEYSDDYDDNENSSSKRRKFKGKDSSRKHEAEDEYFEYDDKHIRTPSPAASDEEDYDEAAAGGAAVKKETQKRGYPIEFKDVKRVQVRRSHVFDNMYKPGFEDAVKGMFVRSRCAQGNGQISKMSKITGIARLDEYVYDKAHGQRTSIVLLIKSPEESQDHQLQVHYVSEQDITEDEFNAYKSAAERAGEPIIERSLKKMHNNFIASLKKQFTGKQLEELSKSKGAMPDIYLRKDKIQRSLTTLLNDNSDGKNDSSIAYYKEQLKEIRAKIEAYERKKKEEKIKLEKRSAAAAAAQMAYRDPSLKAYKKALAIALAGKQEDKPPTANKLDLVKGVMTGKCSREDLKKYYNFELDFGAPLKLRQPTLAYPVPPLPSDVKVITLADYVSTHK